MKEKILITGFNGHIAQKLNNFLDKNKYELNYLTTKKNECSNNVFYWEAYMKLEEYKKYAGSQL